MQIAKEDIQRIIAERKARLERLSNPDTWHIFTKNMESGEYKAFKQSCVDDEIIIFALERMLREHPTEKGGAEK